MPPSTRVGAAKASPRPAPRSSKPDTPALGRWDELASEASNHDDRATLRQIFGSPGSGDDPVCSSFDAGPLRVVAADTSIPGQVTGQLDIEWIEAALAQDPTTPTILALHHPPIAIGFSAMDAFGVPAEQRAALATLLDRSPQMLRVITGHVHRAATGSIGGRAVTTAPSVNFQLALDLAGDALEVVTEPPGLLLHVLLPSGELVTHLQPVPRV